MDIRQALKPMRVVAPLVWPHRSLYMRAYAVVPVVVPAHRGPGRDRPELNACRGVWRNGSPSPVAAQAGSTHPEVFARTRNCEPQLSDAEPMVLRLFGAGDVATATGLRMQLRRAALATHGRQLVIDLSDVPFMDAAGLASLIETRGLLGERLTIRNPPWSLLRILEALRLTDQFTIVDTAFADPGE